MDSTETAFSFSKSIALLIVKKSETADQKKNGNMYMLSWEMATDDTVRSNFVRQIMGNYY